MTQIHRRAEVLQHRIQQCQALLEERMILNIVCHACEKTMPDREEQHYVNPDGKLFILANGWSEQYTRILRAASNGEMSCKYSVVYTCPECQPK